METYRSGRNENDSKSFCLEIGTWVRIPPSPPENGDKSMFLACRHLFICLPPRGFLTGSPPSLGQFPGQCQGLLHGRGAELFGLRIQVSVDVGCGGDVTVAQPFLNLLHGHSLFQQQAGTGVPLRYNNDKQKKPLFSRGLSVCRLLFKSFSKLKIDENYKEKRRLFY